MRTLSQPSRDLGWAISTVIHDCVLNLGAATLRPCGSRLEAAAEPPKKQVPTLPRCVRFSRDRVRRETYSISAARAAPQPVAEK